MYVYTTHIFKRKQHLSVLGHSAKKKKSADIIHTKMYAAMLTRPGAKTRLKMILFESSQKYSDFRLLLYLMHYCDVICTS